MVNIFPETSASHSDEISNFTSGIYLRFRPKVLELLSVFGPKMDKVPLNSLFGFEAKTMLYIKTVNRYKNLFLISNFGVPFKRALLKHDLRTNRPIFNKIVV